MKEGRPSPQAAEALTHYVASGKKPLALALHCLGLKTGQLDQCMLVEPGPAYLRAQPWAVEGQKKATVSGRPLNREGINIWDTLVL